MPGRNLAALTALAILNALAALLYHTWHALRRLTTTHP